MLKSVISPSLPDGYANLPQILFPNKVLTGKSGHEFLWSIYHSAKDYRDTTILLDFSELSFFEGNLSALLLALTNKLKVERNLKFECVARDENYGMNLLIRNGLYRLLSDKADIVIPDYQQSTVQANLFNLDEEERFLDYIEQDLLGHHSLENLPPDLRDWLLNEFFFETFTNIRVHSNSILPFTACGQHFPKKNKTHFSICDLGDGFFRKINAFTSAEIKDPQIAIEWALRGGSTQRERGGSALKNIFSRCRENGFGLSIVTDGLIWELKNGKIRCRRLEEQILGASIHLVFTNL